MTEKPKRGNLPLPKNFTLVRRVIEQLRLAWLLFFDPRVPILLKVLPVFGLAYAISPIDLMPDIFPLLGWLDDLAVVLVTLVLYITLSPPVVRREYLRQMRLRDSYRVRVDKDGIVIDVKANAPADEDDQPGDGEDDEELYIEPEQERVHRTRR